MKASFYRLQEVMCGLYFMLQDRIQEAIATLGATAENGFLDSVQRQFTAHVAGFDLTTDAHRFHYDLKRVHSLQVAAASADIGRAIGLTGTDLVLAEAIGLLHDVGRFTQYARYETFNDRLSLDHGDLGASILSDDGWLTELDDHHREMIITAVRHHNKAALPKIADSRTDCLARLIRDADKLDILRVLEGIFQRPDWLVLFDIPKGDDISEAVLEDILHQRVVSSEHMKNHIDFIFMRIGWLYDINYAPTLQRILSRGYDAMLRSQLPATENIQNALAALEDFLGVKSNTLF